MRRRTLAIVAVGLLAVTAGCAGVFGGEISDERLDEEPPAPYDWNTTRDVTVTVHGGSYQAVYDLSNRTRLELYQPALGNDQPLNIRSLRYRYPNGTVVNGSNPAIQVSTEGSNRVVVLPNGSGMVGYTSGSGPKEFGMPAYVEGTYEVILPPGHRTDSLILGKISPGGFETSVDDRNRLHVVWDEDVSGSVYVRYFLARDKVIFRGLVIALGIVALGGVLYYRRKIRQLEQQRKELGLDVDTDDDFGRDPPPGMR